MLTPSSVTLTDGGSGYRPEHAILIPSSHLIWQLLSDALAEIERYLCYTRGSFGPWIATRAVSIYR